MLDHIEKYTQKLLRDRTAMPESIRLYRLDDVVIASRSDEWLPVFTEVFTGLNVTALLFGTLTLPFADLLVERSAPEEDRIKPRDSETRDVPARHSLYQKRRMDGKVKGGACEKDHCLPQGTQGRDHPGASVWWHRAE